ncbi:MAG: phosphoribosylanthranilate isomerase [Kiritimatiellae bacterium]|nr:phosphoribosylanthranilate isomerase [Kiritimatiellia bacterium]
MPLFVKICGLCRADDIAAANEAAPDAVGFVFWPRSVRAVRPEQVAEWLPDLRPDLERVGVFVNPAPDELRRAVDIAGLTIVQLHGEEPPSLAAGLRVWKAMPAAAASVSAATGWPAEAIVLDSGTGQHPGGTGLPADWHRAAAFTRAFPGRVVLAGGLTPDNVAAAVREVAPWGVDASTGVESAPGRKDAAKMKEFVQRCRAL